MKNLVHEHFLLSFTNFLNHFSIITFRFLRKWFDQICPLHYPNYNAIV